MINNSVRFITRLLHKCEVLITRDRYHFDISGEIIRKLLFKSGRRKKLANPPFRLLQISPLRREVCASCIISAINVSWSRYFTTIFFLLFLFRANDCLLEHNEINEGPYKRYFIAFGASYRAINLCKLYTA